MSRNIFITGTGTDVGKTYVAGLIVKKLVDSGRVAGYYKAAMSGNERDADGNLVPGDALHVKNVAKIPQPLQTMCPYVYEVAVSPHLASRLEGNPVKIDVVREGFETVCAGQDFVTVEGSGGILCPIDIDNEELLLEDIIRELDLKTILVADAGLGTINSVVLTHEYMKARGLAVKGIIYNNYHPGNVMEEDNIIMCERMTGLPTLARVEPGATDLDIDVNELAQLYE